MSDQPTGSKSHSGTPFQFVYTNYDAQSPRGTANQGMDGRRKDLRQFRPASQTESMDSLPPTPTTSGVPSSSLKRALSDQTDGPSAKRRRGRPRKIPEAGGTVVSFGKFVVPGISRTQSAPECAPAPIFSRSRDPPQRTASLPEESPLAPTHPSTTNSNPPERPPITRQMIQTDVVIPEDEVGGGEKGGEDGADGSGLGAPDEQPDDEEDELDPAEPGDEQEETTPSPRNPLPLYLQQAFDAKVDECRIRDEHGRPPLYSKYKTFWFPKSSSWFLLQDPDPTPQKLFNPSFFLWDPLALYKNLPCPNCKTTLQRHSHVRRPRRVVSLNSTFWIIGYRYYCRSCRSAKRKGKQASFQSWDSRILAVLPGALAAEFPARLTHRSGLELATVDWLRSCFQYGLGSKQFSDALRSQHRLRYDRLHLQYLQYIKSQVLSTWIEKRFPAFPQFEDRSPHGYHGYVPSGNLIRNVYDHYIEEHSHHFHQHMALLSAEICAIDHSHKFTKHIVLVDGERVFSALLIVTNERGEIRVCCLVATKSHAQFEDALRKMSESLETYGLSQPRLFYTDNVQADRQFLTNVFPSLSEDITPKSLRARKAINLAIQSIMVDLPDSGDGTLVVGFDMEWSVKVGANERVMGRGPVAVVQIAYKDCVYVLQIAEHVKNGNLPHHLKLFLSNSRIKKVGRQVKADLISLQKASHSTVPFAGGVELVDFARERCVLESRLANPSIGLNDLCALLLGRCLPKNVAERVSETWESVTLSDSQIQYAATDAWASLCLYNRLLSIPVPAPLPPWNDDHSLPPVGTPVLIYGEDQSIIARGSIASQKADLQFGKSALRSQIVVTVRHVVVPGAVVMSHKRMALSAFGSAPFNLLAARSKLRVYQPVVLHSIPGPPSHHDLPSDGEHNSADTVGSGDSNDRATGIHDGPSLSDLIFDTVDVMALNRDMQSGGDLDRDSLNLGLEILGPIPTKWEQRLYSRVLKDPFHVFNMFYIHATHGLRVAFARALRDAIFIPDPQDLAKIAAWGQAQNPPVTLEYLWKFRVSWLLKHCRRIIPPPEQLYPAVSKVFSTYGPLKDSTTHAPLFNKESWKTAKNILQLIYNGYLSDPPGIQLYTKMGVGKDTGLPIYRCLRGTNSTEGGVHTHLRSHLPSSGTSIRHAQACLMDFSLVRNLNLGTLNSTGKPYQGHSSIWITNMIQEYLLALGDQITNRSTQALVHLNTNFYAPTKEVIGVLRIPESVKSDSGILSSLEPNQADSRTPKQQQLFLARLQGTRKAILPVHTAREKALFNNLMRTNPAFNPPTRGGQPNWREATCVWNREADVSDDIYYKINFKHTMLNA
ncbi:hypothetical protein DFP72DRAFT_1174556 [Ephemerocybe angulata]|uniref:3'-5' exonuclease domain-containing protein n=1 Tax=Ephemerocybe angulata TaxID=980116 RepID=A0A8H6HJ48_9AGAR|nr:hypothetical protein DFP72DRAFT_1174556 [Tulosesus angulatus]